MNELHLFAGAGGGILGGLLLGHRPVCAVEIEPYCREVLLQRQRDGILPWFPIWDDVRTFDGKPWRGIAGVVCGGFPCQDISAAGNGKGLDGARSGLWFEMARIVDEIRPAYVFVENSPMLLVRGFERVLGDLASLGYDAKWGVLGAGDIGGNHGRRRIWILAYSDKKLERWPGRRVGALEKLIGIYGTPGKVRSIWKNLKPSFVETVMMWPEGWTGLQPLETDKFRLWQQAHGGYCLDT